jgi:hypothetical protein
MQQIEAFRELSRDHLTTFPTLDYIRQAGTNLPFDFLLKDLNFKDHPDAETYEAYAESVAHLKSV